MRDDSNKRLLIYFFPTFQTPVELSVLTSVILITYGKHLLTFAREEMRKEKVYRVRVYSQSNRLFREGICVTLNKSI